MKLTIGDAIYDFEYRVNSMCDLEREAGANIGEVLSMPKYNMLRFMVWAGLIRNHKIPLERVGDLVEEYLKEHEHEELVKVITEAITESGFMTAHGQKKKSK
jgi:hypothetical protein